MSDNTGPPGGTASPHVNGGDRDAEELLVFGYESKLYRDDDKAAFIENEKHLIPWMGDNSILVDRYDVRGLLTDLKQGSGPSTLPSTEPSQILDLGYDDRLTSLDEVERLCDGERYMALHDEEDDELTFHEMEFQRLQSAVSGMDQSQDTDNYSSVGFNYDNDGSSARVETSAVDTSIGPDSEKIMIAKALSPPRRRKSSHETPFVPPPGLQIPPEMILPPKMKVHAIIEKTAKFVASHGAQMEIIVKTKQAHNKHFNFLYYNDPLNEYYKNLLYAIKENHYKPSEETSTVQDEDSSDEESGGEDDDGPGYLHPSLMNAREEIGKSTSLSFNFRSVPNSNSAYSMLVSKIKEVTGVPSSQDAFGEPPPPPPDDSEFNSYETMYGYGGSGYQGGVSYGNAANQVRRATPSTVRAKPNAQEQVIIEKMASYVIKNGPAFESVAGTKGDTRFQFLDPSHPHHWYYLNCKKRFSVEASAVVASGNPVGYTTTAGTSSTTTITTTTSTTATAAATIKANHANAISRMATLPPELINKIEELRKKTQQNKLLRESQQQEAVAEKKPVIKFSSSLANVNLGGTSETAINAVSETNVGSQPTLVSYASDETLPIELTARSEAEKFTDKIEDQQSEPNTKMSDSGSPSEPLSIKEERRRKATLFLQRLKRPSTDKENSVQSQPCQPGNAEPDDSEDTPQTVLVQNEINEDGETEALNNDPREPQPQAKISENPQEMNPDIGKKVESIPPIDPAADSSQTKASSEEEGEIPAESEDNRIRRSGHRKHRRNRSRNKSRSRSKSKPKRRKMRESSGSSVIAVEEEMQNRSPKCDKKKSHKRKKHSSKTDDPKKSKKSLKKKKKHHKEKSSKSHPGKTKLHREK